MSIVSQADYAKMRGVSRKTVTQWKKDGKLTIRDRGVDVEATDKFLERYRKGGVTGNTQGNAAGNTPPPALAVDEDDSPTVAAAKIIAFAGADLSFDEARRIKENYLALLNKLEYQQKEGSLVDLALAEQVLFEGARAARDAWLNFPAKIGPMLAAEIGLEADRVTEALTAYVHKQIAELGEPEADFAAR